MPQQPSSAAASPMLRCLTIICRLSISFRVLVRLRSQKPWLWEKEKEGLYWRMKTYTKSRLPTASRYCRSLLWGEPEAPLSPAASVPTTLFRLSLAPSGTYDPPLPVPASAAAAPPPPLSPYPLATPEPSPPLLLLVPPLPSPPFRVSPPLPPSLF